MATREQLDGFLGGNIQGDGTTEPERKYDAAVAGNPRRSRAIQLKQDILRLIGAIDETELIDSATAAIPLANLVKRIADDFSESPVILAFVATALAEYIDGVK